jgi:hypothetical protein
MIVNLGEVCDWTNTNFVQACADPNWILFNGTDGGFCCLPDYIGVDDDSRFCNKAENGYIFSSLILTSV